MEHLPAWANIGSIIAALSGLIWGFMQRFSKVRAESDRQRIENDKQTASDAHKIIETKDELIAVQKERAEAWKTKYETEHEEFAEHRKESHSRLNEAQKLVLKHTEEVADLRAKTDLSPMLKHIEQQTEVNGKLITTLSEISTTLGELTRRVIGAH